MSASPHKPRITQAEFVAGAKAARDLPPPTSLEIAFAGRSNVGKSSLLNALVNRRSLARTSGTPGCTRQISFFQVGATDGSKVLFVDLPGYGYAKRSKSERADWAGLIESYLLERPTLRAVAVLFDIRRGPEDEEQELLRLLAEPARVARPPLIPLLVGTKLDKISRPDQKPALAKLNRQLGRSFIPTSANEPKTIERLWDEIRKALGFEDLISTPETR